MSKKRLERQKKGTPRSSEGRGRSLKSRQVEERVRITVRVLNRWAKRGWAWAEPFIVRNQIIIKSWAIFVGAILGFILTLPIYYGFFSRLLPPLIAKSTGFIVSIFGTEAQVSGTLIISPLFSVKVIPACSGIFPTILFISAVLAYPCKLKEKFIGILLGIPAIFLVNLIRMVSLFYVGAYLPQIFEATHLLFWQSLMIIAAVFLWLLWAQRFTHAHVARR
ncbi:exosortase H [Candidatus Bipolaricaulota bacterium]|nr:exosortase H [Candidatus Bipolaricaulota bacterium]